MAWMDRSGTHLQQGRPWIVGEEPYSPKTLEGNWYEERCDTKAVLKPKLLPSKYEDYYQTTYQASYSQEEKVPKRTLDREPHIYPGHQPELDPPETKFIPKSCYMIDYIAPDQKRRALLAAMKGRAEEPAQSGEQKATKSSVLATLHAGHHPFGKATGNQAFFGPSTSKIIPQSCYTVDYMAPSERRKLLRAFLDKTEGGAKESPAQDKVTKPAPPAPPVFKKEPPVFCSYRPEPGPPKVDFFHKSCYMTDYVAPDLRS